MKDNKKKPVSVTLGSKERIKVDALAREQKMSRSEMVRFLIRTKRFNKRVPSILERRF